MPCPRSWRGAAPSEGAQAVRWPVLRVHLALRRWSQRPSIDRRALDCRQLSCRHVTRVSPSNSFSVCSLFSALSAGACPLVLSGSGKPLTHGSPLHPSHLRWGCCMNYCGAPDAVSRQVQRFVRPGRSLRMFLLTSTLLRSAAIRRPTAALTTLAPHWGQTPAGTFSRTRSSPRSRKSCVMDCACMGVSQISHAP